MQNVTNAGHPVTDLSDPNGENTQFKADPDDDNYVTRRRACTSGRNRIDETLDCQDADTQAQYIEGSLPPEQEETFRTHMGSCHDCASSVNVALSVLRKPSKAGRRK